MRRESKRRSPRIGESIDEWSEELKGCTMHAACSDCLKPVDNYCDDHTFADTWVCIGSDFDSNLKEIYINRDGVREL
jgi:hypothetical protein